MLDSPRIRSALATVNWVLIAVGCFLSMLPLFLLGEPLSHRAPVGVWTGFASNSTQPNFVNDDVAVASTMYNDASSMAYTSVQAYLTDTTGTHAAEMKLQSTGSTIRMTMLERFCFQLGVGIASMCIFFPPERNTFMLLSLVQICTAMVSQILTTCPVLIFLERNTQCFHPIVTTFIILTMVVGSICLSFDFYVPPTGVLPDKVYVSSVAFCTTAYVLIMFICVVAFAQYVYTKRADKGGAADVDVFEEFSVSAVPAYHMVALFFVSGLNVVWSNFPPLPVITTFDSSLFAVVNLFSFSLVFVVDMRIRKNDVNKGLDDLQSKRAFIRFVSHEIRTPLSTATIGLELLNDMLSRPHTSPAPAPHASFAATGGGEADSAGRGRKQSASLLHVSTAPGSGVAEQLEIVQLISQSIQVAKGIFDDLIQYDQTGGSKEGMALSYETVDARELVSTLAMPLRIQALQRGVFFGDVAVDTNYAPQVWVDVRRMGQAVRTLLAAAIAAAPERSEVRLAMYRADKLGLAAKGGGGVVAAAGPEEGAGEAAETATGSLRRTSLLGGAAVTPERRRRPTRPLRRSLVNTLGLKQLSLKRRAVVASDDDAVNDGKFVVVEMSYMGAGFNPADARRVNVEMFTFNPNEIHGGGGTGGGTQSGLGMALAKVIVEAQGGRVWVHSDGPGKLSSLMLGLPVSRASAPAGPNERPSTQVKDATRDGVKKRDGSDTLLAPFSANSKEATAADPTALVAVAAAAAAVTASDVDVPASADAAPAVSPTELPGKTVSPPAPAPAPAAPAPAAPVPAPSPMPAPVTAPGLHVLVAEDSPPARKMLVRLLHTMHCTVEEAEDGQQAVDKVKAALADPSARPYDVILMDSVMPNMDGPTAVQIIREMGYKGPILGVTGNTLPEQIADFVAHGVDEVVGKPVRPNELKEAIATRVFSQRGLGVA